jgi:hypothetical protein
MHKRVFLFLSLAFLASGAARAATDPMVGDWKLNPQKSKLVDEMKVASVGGNKYSFDFGGPQAETIAVDGTDQPGMAGTTLSVAAGEGNWVVVRKKGSRVLLRATWTLSKDGNQLQDDYTQFAENGPTTHVVYLYDRRGPGERFAGDWVSTSQQIDSVYLLNVRPFEDGGLSIAVPAEGNTQKVKFDGKDYPQSGSEPGRVTSARRVNERTVELTDKRGENVVRTKEMSISEDGKTLIMTIREPTRTDPNVLVFDRQ